MGDSKQDLANRQNALESTGPRTEAGQAVAKLNALRHGLRAVQTVVPGEDPEAWEVHRTAVVEDLKPAGALELALAETVASKLWRLGRVVRHEADLIMIGQARDEVRQCHEKSKDSMDSSIPKRGVVTHSQRVIGLTEKAVAAREIGLRVLENLDLMKDEDLVPREDWPMWDAIKEDLELDEERMESVFKGEEDFVVRHLRTALAIKGNGETNRNRLIQSWREAIPMLQEKAAAAKKNHKNVLRRYKAALERLRLSRGLPDETALVKVQRYESHLERGLYKALESLHALQESRGARPSSHKPAVALAVVQATSDGFKGTEMGSFGNFEDPS